MGKVYLCRNALTGIFLFWNSNGKFRNNTSKVEGGFNVLPIFCALCCQSAFFCVHPLGKRPEKGLFSGGVRYLYPKTGSLSIMRPGMFEESPRPPRRPGRYSTP